MDGELYEAEGLESHDLGLIIGTDLLVARNIGIDLRYNLGLSNLTSSSSKMTNIGFLLGFSYYFE